MSKIITTIPTFSSIHKSKGPYEALLIKRYIPSIFDLDYDDYEYFKSEELMHAGFIISNKVKSHNKKNNRCLIKIVPSTKEYLTPFKLPSKGVRFNSKIDRIIKSTKITVIVNHEYWSKLDNKSRGEFLLDKLPYYLPSRKQALKHIQIHKSQLENSKKLKWNPDAYDQHGEKGVFEEYANPPMIDLSKLNDDHEINILKESLKLIYEK